MKTKFRNRHDQIKYAKFVEIMRRVRRDPAMIHDARDFVTRYMLPDPHQATYAGQWLHVLSLPADEIAQLLLADTPEGELLRDTAPPFGRGLTSRDVAEIISAL